MGRIGVIGGSGLYNLEGVNLIKEVSLDTPFGRPSDKFFIGSLEDREVVFLPRHGSHHGINPTDINYRANIYAMKSLGVDRLISITACGSLREELQPSEFVIPSQYVDRTNQARKQTFFEDGIVAHVNFAQPVCKDLAEELEKAAKESGVIVHSNKIYLNIDGPQFSTLAESNLYRNWGMDIIGMTNMTEARLAREAEICYITLAAITDYDCWHPDHDSVTVEMVTNNLKNNIKNSKKVLKNFILRLSPKRTCSCQDSLKYAIATDPDHIPQKTKDKLSIILDKYVK